MNFLSEYNLLFQNISMIEMLSLISIFDVMVMLVWQVNN